MKRLLIVCLAGLLVAALFFLWPGPGLLNAFARTSVCRLGTDYLGVEVTAEEVRMSPFRGEIEVVGLRMANPEGFSDSSFAEVGHLRVRADLLSFLSEQGRIYAIGAAPVRLLIERKGVGFNYQPILENLRNRKKVNTAALAGSSSSSLKIDHILLKSVTARVILLAGLEPLEVEIGTVEIQDLDTSNGSAALAQVLEQVLESAQLGEGSESLANTARGLLDSLLGSSSPR